MVFRVLKVLHGSSLEFSSADLLEAKLRAREHEIIDINVATNQIADARWEGPGLGGEQ